MEVKTENYLLETKYIWFATDGNGNEMATFVTETDAREYAMKYGYSVGYEDDYEPEFKCDDCCHPDGTPRKGIGCACGKNDDDYDGDDND